MQDLNNKVDNAGATADGKLSSSEWNEVASELQSFIESTGQTLTSLDLLQIVKGVSQYCTVGDFYTGAGIVNAYTATVVAPMIAPNSLAVGMKIRTIVQITNTGNSTLNAFSSGTIDIMQPGGVHVAAGELSGGTEYEFIYRLSPTIHWEVLNAEIPAIEGISIQAIDYPTIDSADNRIIVAPSVATNGGTVTYPAGTIISLGEEVTAGETGRMAAYKTSLYSSVDLDVSSTYYLRAKWVSGSVVQYIQKGSDADAIPAGLVGTPGGASGGGFDSTVFDILLSRVVTGLAGTLPVVTELANKSDLILQSSVYRSDLPQQLDWATLASTDIAIDWARKPSISSITLSFFASARNRPDGTNLDTGSGNMQMIGFRFKPTLSRYATDDIEFAYDDSTGTNGSSQTEIVLRA